MLVHFVVLSRDHFLHEQCCSLLFLLQLSLCSVLQEDTGPVWSSQRSKVCASLVESSYFQNCYCLLIKWLIKCSQTFAEAFHSDILLHIIHDRLCVLAVLPGMLVDDVWLKLDESFYCFLVDFSVLHRTTSYYTSKPIHNESGA